MLPSGFRMDHTDCVLLDLLPITVNQRICLCEASFFGVMSSEIFLKNVKNNLQFIDTLGRKSLLLHYITKKYINKSLQILNKNDIFVIISSVITRQLINIHDNIEFV